MMNADKQTLECLRFCQVFCIESGRCLDLETGLCVDNDRYDHDNDGTGSGGYDRGSGGYDRGSGGYGGGSGGHGSRCPPNSVSCFISNINVFGYSNQRLARNGIFFRGLLYSGLGICTLVAHVSLCVFSSTAWKVADASLKTAIASIQ